jgi:hypothetical protein
MLTEWSRIKTRGATADAHAHIEIAPPERITDALFLHDAQRCW